MSFSRWIPARPAWGVLVLAATVVAVPARAGDPVPYPARQALDLTDAAAHAWAADAALVYVENDEDVQGGGLAARWAYLYYSPNLDAARGYSVRDGKIVVAEDLGLTFDAPPVSPGWIDSGAALAAAEKKVGVKLREEGADARLATMLLIRGAFHAGKPDMTTWLVVYAAPGQPSTFVVIDAQSGDVRRTWRG